MSHNQKKLWNSKWKKLESNLKATNYSKRVYDFLKDKNAKSILDIGSGDGKDSLYFSKKGYNVTAIDFSSEAIKKLEDAILRRNIDNIKTIVADLKDFELNDKFDVIYANLSLHYFNDKTTTKIFTKLLNLLNKNGYLFVRCKSIEDSLHGIGNEIEKDVFYNHRNGKIQHFFSKKYLKNKLKDYSIIRIRKTTSRHLKMKEGIIKSHFIEAIAQKR